MLRYTIGLTLMALVAYYVSSSLKFNDTSVTDAEEDTVIKKRQKRKPASVLEIKGATELQAPKVGQSQRNISDYREGASTPGEPGSGTGGESNSNSAGGTSSDMGSVSPSSPSSDNSSKRTSSSEASSAAQKKNSAARFYGGGIAAWPPSNNNSVLKPSENTNCADTGSCSDSTDVETVLTCSTDQGGGAFNHPLSVSLSCSATSVITYCLSVDECCDPTVSGTDYTSVIVIGATDGEYCLTFYGNNSSDVSSVVQQRYIINNDLPHLMVEHPKIYYQTTELNGISHLASDEFGKTNYTIGQINMMANNPNTDGLDLNCDEIVTNYVTYPAPTPLAILERLVYDLVPAVQLDVPLIRSYLSYGDNYITSYVKDTNYPAPLYSCSTTKVTLMDFEYFDVNAAHGVDGTGDVREFSGGFTAYGFFEDDTTVYRGPAGSSSQDSGGQLLQSGLFGMFYEGGQN